MTIELEKSNTVAFWCNQIEFYEKEFGKWEKRSTKIVKRYKDERTESEAGRAQFNILWSNVQTLAPAAYAKPPMPNIDRRFQDDDKLGTVAAQVLERAVNYFIDADEFDDIMKQSVLDRLLPGRGTAWVRYVPNFKDADVQGSVEVRNEGVQATDDQQTGEEQSAEAEQEVYSEDVVADYVHWQDFGHTWARTWQEVRAVWRKVPMSRRELVDRFGPKGKDVPMDSNGRKDDKTPDDQKRATVYEIWDKTTKKAFWINKDYANALDERQDPLKLKNFFPCPKPLYATLANDNLIPTPDYIQYQDQAKELDDMTGRINALVKCVKAVGVYDASAQGIERMMAEGVENTLIPVEQWAVHADKGGLKGTVEFMPLADIIAALVALYDARERAKQDLYEITGISDIIRGASNPNETLGAQELKGKYAGLRMDNIQKDVARYSRDLVRLFTEIIAEHFSLETIKQISGFKLFTAAEKQQIQMQIERAEKQAQLAQMQGGQPQPMPPIPDEMQEMLDNPTWEEVIGLIKDETARCFRIDIETDSTIKVDQEAEKAARTEFLSAVGSFLQQAVMMPPDLQPLLMQMLMFGIRGFKVSREIESTFDVALNKIKQQAENPQSQPDPAQAEADAKAQAESQRTELEVAKMQQDGQFKQAELQLKQAELQLKQAELQLKQQDIEYKYGLENKKVDADLVKSRIDAKAKVDTDLAMSDPDLNGGMEVTPMAAMMSQLADTLTQGLTAIAQIQAQGNQAVVDAIQNPPVREVIRDKQGKIAGVK